MSDILDPDYKSDLTDAKSEELLLLCGHTIRRALGRLQELDGQE